MQDIGLRRPLEDVQPLEKLGLLSALFDTLIKKSQILRLEGYFTARSTTPEMSLYYYIFLERRRPSFSPKNPELAGGTPKRRSPSFVKEAPLLLKGSALPL